MALVLSQASIRKTLSNDRPESIGRSVYALVKEDNLIRSSCLQVVDKSHKDAIEGKCDTCNKIVYFKPSHSEILKIACCRSCEKQQGWKTTHDIELVLELENERKKKLEELEFGFEYDEYGGILDNRPDFCPSCNGAKNERSYDHTPECPISPINKLKAKEALRNSTCPVCGGPKSFGMGYKHTPECPESSANKVKVKSAPKSFCPKCNGPNRGPGFSHTKECPDAALNKLKAITQAKKEQRQLLKKELGLDGPLPEVCPKCGGVRKGRGYSHKDGCEVKNGKV